MSKRLEFTKATKLAIFRRAGGPEDLRCEGCKAPLMGKSFEYDHTLECWEMEDVEHGYRDPLTAEDGKLLCLPCHQEKTGRKAGERAHGKRIQAKAAKAKPKRSSFLTNRDGPYRKKLNGEIERR